MKCLPTYLPWKNAIAGALMLGLVAACDTGTGPEEDAAFDAEAALQDHQALDSILDSPGMDAFRALSRGVTFRSFGEEVTLAGKVAAELDRAGNPGISGTLAARLWRLTVQEPPEPTEDPIISSLRRGKTFVYDPERGRYVVDPDRTGAPETGVRFILYEPGPDGPDPEKEMGYADLIDEGDDSAQEIALRLVVVEGETTILDYRTTVDVMESGGAVAVNGFLQGENDRLDFQVQVMGTAGADGGSIDITFEMGIQERDFLISGTVQGADDDSGEGGEILLSVTHGSDSFSVDVEGDGETVEGTILLNGELFATIQGDADDPVITGASGEELTWEEIMVLLQILDASEDVFDLFEDLLDPVDELVILALIL